MGQRGAIPGAVPVESSAALARRTAQLATGGGGELAAEGRQILEQKTLKTRWAPTLIGGQLLQPEGGPPAMSILTERSYPDRGGVPTVVALVLIFGVYGWSRSSVLANELLDTSLRCCVLRGAAQARRELAQTHRRVGEQPTSPDRGSHTPGRKTETNAHGQRDDLHCECHCRTAGDHEFVPTARAQRPVTVTTGTFGGGQGR